MTSLGHSDLMTNVFPAKTSCEAYMILIYVNISFYYFFLMDAFAGVFFIIYKNIMKSNGFNNDVCDS